MIRWAGPRVAELKGKRKIHYYTCFRAFMLCHMMSSSVRYTDIVLSKHKYSVYLDLMKHAKRWLIAWQRLAKVKVRRTHGQSSRR